MERVDIRLMMLRFWKIKNKDSHSCDRGLSPGQGKHILYALNNIQLISDEFSVEFLLYLCE